MAISATTIHALSQETNASAELCKMALERANGDMLQAKQNLERWQVSASRAADTLAFGSSLAFFSSEFQAATLVSLKTSSEAFGKSQKFKELIVDISTSLLEDEEYNSDSLINESALKENCRLLLSKKRIQKTAPISLLTAYTWNDRAAAVIEIAVSKEETLLSPVFKNFCFDCAMHAVAFNPIFIDDEQIPEKTRIELVSSLEKELRDSGKSMSVWGDFIKGKIAKWQEKRSMMKQIFIKDDKKTVKEVLERLENELKDKISICHLLTSSENN